jgi:hypothetical protein
MEKGEPRPRVVVTLTWLYIRARFSGLAASLLVFSCQFWVISMNSGSKKLSPVDATAIDLILDHPDPQMQYSRPATNVSQPRVKAATKLLRLLDHLPTQEPPVDLAAKTLRFVEHAIARQVGRHTQPSAQRAAQLH